MKYMLSNKELQEAINDTIEHIRSCIPAAPRYQILNDHLSKLLEVQKKRARLAQMVDPQEN